tara:strand:+ start:3764 stop:6070 length:2307 start_codon:yes stop_codon:yes gene_type:complete
MKNFTQRFIGLLALVFAMSFNAVSQEITQDNIGSAVDLWLSDQDLAETTYGHISDWDVSSVTDMSFLFNDSDFNQDIGSWDVSSVTTMRQMFEGSENFNQDIGGWDVSGVVDMRKMFSNSGFNQDIGGWDVSNVTDMKQMFNGSGFNQDIGGWDVSNVTTMYGMFANGIFNQDIGNWNVSNVSNMTFMFNHNISFSSENYDSLLIGWSTLNLQMNVTLSTVSVGYNTSCVERELIINIYGWTISDGGLVALDGDCVGCMDVEANNYNSDAGLDDGSCTYNGCTDESAFNFNENANVDDGSCVDVVEGCTSSQYLEFSTEANTDDGSCLTLYGCTDVTALNYNSNADLDDGSCEYFVALGCTDSNALNYNQAATGDDGSCVLCSAASSNLRFTVYAGFSGWPSWHPLYNPNETWFNGDLASLLSVGDLVYANDGTPYEVRNFESLLRSNSTTSYYVTTVDFNSWVGGVFAPDSHYDTNVSPCVLGCNDETASNFNPNANTNNGTCVPYLNLPLGWSMFGYTCIDSLDVLQAFTDISDKIEIVKDEWGLAYLPSYGFSAFDNLEFGEGYQIKMIEEVNHFEFCNNDDYNVGYSDGAASVTPEDGITQADVDAAVAEVEATYADYTAPLNLQIGDQHVGGIVFQINENGSGLVAAMEDLGPYKWNVALNVARDYSSEGYTGWYLPSLEESLLMFNTIGNGGSLENVSVPGNFHGDHWTSTQENLQCTYSGCDAWTQYYACSMNSWRIYYHSGSTETYQKYNNTYIRPIRAF